VRSLQKSRTANRRFKKQIDEAEAPDAGEEYLLYQTLLGTWPVDLDGAPVPSVGQEFVTRIQHYIAKALKEAKLNTSWIQPNENWDDAMREFVARILEPGLHNKFLPIFLPVAAEIARLGAINSLAQTAIKLTAPGVPDIYQGTEIWDDSLVDPDNRRPIDYARRHGDRAMIVIVPRLSSHVGFPPVGDRWQDTHVAVPPDLSNLRDVFCDRELRVENSQLKLAVAMSQLPFAVLEN